MTSLDGIIAVPKGLKREARRLVLIAFMLAPIGVLATFALTQTHPTPTAQRTVTAPAEPPVGLAAPLMSPSSAAPLATSSKPQSSSIELHATQSGPSQAPTTQLKVNQQPVDVPANGSVHKVISNDTGTTTIDISNSSSSVSDSSSSSTNIQLNATSNTITNSETSTGP